VRHDGDVPLGAGADEAQEGVPALGNLADGLAAVVVVPGVVVRGDEAEIDVREVLGDLWRLRWRKARRG